MSVGAGKTARLWKWPGRLYGWAGWLLLALFAPACTAPTPPALPTVAPWPTPAPAPTPALRQGPGLLLLRFEGREPLTTGAEWAARMATRAHRATLRPDTAFDLPALLRLVEGSTVIGGTPSDEALATSGAMLGELVADSALHRPTLGPAQGWQGEPSSFSPRLEARLSLTRDGTEQAALWLLALDTRNDGLTAYDSYLLDDDKSVDAGSRLLTAPTEGSEDAASGRWADIWVGADAGGDWLLLDPQAASLTLYSTPVRRFRAWPPSFQASLSASLGFYPPEPDTAALSNGWIAPADLATMVARQAAWIGAAAGLAWQHEQPTLLVASWPAPPPELHTIQHEAGFQALLPAFDGTRDTLFALAPPLPGGSGWWWAAGAGLIPPTPEASPPSVAADTVLPTAARLLGRPLDEGESLDEWLEVP